jgi:transcriptional regulator with XRE-family HTH domain
MSLPQVSNSNIKYFSLSEQKVKYKIFVNEYKICEVKMTPAQLRAARALLKIGGGDLAALAGVDKMAVVRAESGSKKSYVGTIEKLRIALENAGIVFLDGVVGEYEPTAALRCGVKSADTKSELANNDASNEPSKDFSSAAWDDFDDFDDFASDQPVTPYIIPISDADRANLRQHFADPERWNKLSERAKSVYRRELGLNDSAS